MTATSERGASSLLVIAMVGLLVTVTAALLGAVALLHAHRTAASAADLAALAAAHEQVLGGDGCAVAAEVAQENGAVLTDCRPDGAGVRVAVGIAAPGWVGTVTGAVLKGEAVAGPSDPGEESVEVTSPGSGAQPGPEPGHDSGRSSGGGSW